MNSPLNGPRIFHPGFSRTKIGSGCATPFTVRVHLSCTDTSAIECILHPGVGNAGSVWYYSRFKIDEADVIVLTRHVSRNKKLFLNFF
jgi:hypothetical protein